MSVGSQPIRAGSKTRRMNAHWTSWVPSHSVETSPSPTISSSVWTMTTAYS